VYDQTYNWTIGYNDSAGNIDYSLEFSFTVVDIFVPDVVEPASQTPSVVDIFVPDVVEPASQTPSPPYQYNDTVIASINVTEPINASGLHKVWINYSTNNWATYTIKDITLTQNYTFSFLVYDQTYNWTIGYNDTAGNIDYSLEFSFTIVDTFVPYVVIAANQNTTTPDFNESIMVSINVTEPTNASGLTTNNWATNTIKDITLTQNHTFTSLVYGQTYNWTMGYNDTVGNTGYSTELSFTVADTFAPDVVIAANQNTTTPHKQLGNKHN
jgi:hypothetical protein